MRVRQKEAAEDREQPLPGVCSLKASGRVDLLHCAQRPRQAVADQLPRGGVPDGRAVLTEEALGGRIKGVGGGLRAEQGCAAEP